MILFSCKKEDPILSEPTLPQPNPMVYHQRGNVSYATHPYQKADVYLPVGRSQVTSTVILIHGGGWTNGDKWEMEPFHRSYLDARKNLAYRQYDYRLAIVTEFKHPAQVNDIWYVDHILSSKSIEKICYFGIQVAHVLYVMHKAP